MSLWEELQKIPRNDWPKYIKKNHPDLWMKLAWSKVNEWRDNQKNQASVLGDTPDYSRSLFTLDERATEMVHYAFKKYWEDGLIYKNAYLVNWSVGLQTALSDVSGEIEYEKRVDPFISFYYKPIKFDLAVEEANIPIVAKLHDYFDNNPIEVSTVRPETIFGDVAVAIHPNILTKNLQKAGFDLAEIAEAKNIIRNNKLGMELGIKPLGVTGIRLIIADEVEADFGSGSLKITPASDISDYEIWQKYLEGDFPHSVGRDGKLTTIAGKFAGMTTEEARPHVILVLLESGYVPKTYEKEINHWLKLRRQKLSQGLYLEKTDDVDKETDFKSLNLKKQYDVLNELYPEYQINWNYEHNVSICERSKTVIEPLISEEFFLSYKVASKTTGKTLQQHGLEGVEETQFYSQDYKERASNFIENINDWCISRDLLWGHKIPVWYNLKTNPEKLFYNSKEAGDKMFVGTDKPNLPGEWVQEEKIFDTWFSSCLWPLSTLGYLDTVKNTQDLVIIHGGESFEKDEDVLEFIKNWDVNVSNYQGIRENKGSWKDSLTEKLGKENIRVTYPQFPNKLDAKYGHWKIWFEKVLEEIKKSNKENNLNFLGHSLGGNFLLKYLSENDLQVQNLYLVASCISEGDFKTDLEKLSSLENKVQNIYIYHSKDDQIVSFEEAETIKSKLPKAKLIEFENKGHFIDEEFVEIEQQIKKDLTTKPSPSDFERFYPTQEMTTAKEIFYLWIVRMVVLGKYFTSHLPLGHTQRNTIPFQSIIITPTVLDDKGRKMSKSLGNGLDPVAAINSYSSDALRLAMLGGMIPNRNMKMGGKIADSLMEKYRNYGNKIWNVARFLEGLEEDIDK